MNEAGDEETKGSAEPAKQEKGGARGEKRAEPGDELVRAAKLGNPPEVEKALGFLIDTVGPLAAAEAAKRGAAAALQEERWAVVGFLADFVADTLEAGGDLADLADEVPVETEGEPRAESGLAAGGAPPREAETETETETETWWAGLAPHPKEPAGLSEPQDRGGASITALIVPCAAQGQNARRGATEPKGAQRGQAVTFQVVYPGAAPGTRKNGPSDYVKLASPDESLEGMQGKSEVVVREPVIRVKFDYPLKAASVFELAAPGGAASFTREALVRAVARKYAEIYAEEERTAPVPPGTHPRFPNKRSTTDGAYGIYGHRLDELHLHRVEFDPEAEAYTLGVVDL